MASLYFSPTRSMMYRRNDLSWDRTWHHQTPVQWALRLSQTESAWPGKQVNSKLPVDIINIGIFKRPVNSISCIVHQNVHTTVVRLYGWYHLLYIILNLNIHFNSNRFQLFQFFHLFFSPGSYINNMTLIQEFSCRWFSNTGGGSVISIIISFSSSNISYFLWSQL